YHVEPFPVAHLSAARPQRIQAMFCEPLVHVEEEILFAPEHPGQRLSHDAGCIFADTLRSNGAIELVRLAPATLHEFSKAVEGIAEGSRRQVTEPPTDRGRFPRAHIALIVGGSLGSRVLRV